MKFLPQVSTGVQWNNMALTTLSAHQNGRMALTAITSCLSLNQAKSQDYVTMETPSQVAPHIIPFLVQITWQGWETISFVFGLTIEIATKNRNR
jgi:hypothetical protein